MTLIELWGDAWASYAVVLLLDFSPSGGFVQ